MKRVLSVCVFLAVIVFGSVALAEQSVTQPPALLDEARIMAEFKSVIPSTAFKTVDDLYAKQQEVLAGKSKAVLIDIRREAEFDTGHIKNSNNIEAENVYTVPKKITDPATEMWVFCRTKHRATYFVGMLYKYGYKNVFLVDNGISAWAEKGYPLVNKYLGEIKVAKYQHNLSEEFQFRENK
jgi:rhodanese-related sulfurtransferase